MTTTTTNEADHVRLDVRMPREFHAAIEEICNSIGISKTSFFLLSAAQYAYSLEGKKSKKAIRDQLGKGIPK